MLIDNNRNLTKAEKAKIIRKAKTVFNELVHSYMEMTYRKEQALLTNMKIDRTGCMLAIDISFQTVRG